MVASARAVRLSLQKLQNCPRGAQKWNLLIHFANNQNFRLLFAHIICVLQEMFALINCSIKRGAYRAVRRLSTRFKGVRVIVKRV